MSKSLRIGIDARLYNQTGVGRYIRNLLYEFLHIDTSHTFIIYLRKKEFDEFKISKPNFEKRLLDVPWHGLREQLYVPFMLKKDHIDVAHFPYFNVPIFYTGPYLLTIHDLIIDHFDTGRASTLPKFLYKLKRLGYKFAVSEGIKRASHITTISQTTKKEVLEHYFVSPNKVTVTYDALDEHFKSLIPKKTLAKPIFNFPYILYVGNAYPHKNLERLLQSFEIIRQKNKDIRLVLAGDDKFFYPRLEKYAKLLQCKDSIIFYGLANDLQLLSLYSFARTLVFPSLMEGFGLPTFEVLSCDVLPVVSDIPVFREIWGDVLPMVDPNDIESMATELQKILEIPTSTYKHRVQRAKLRIDNYSFNKTAFQTLSIYEKIASKK